MQKELQMKHNHDPAGYLLNDNQSAIGVQNMAVLQGADAVARGVSRFFHRNGIKVAREVKLDGGRRADLMGVDSKGQIIIVEIKVSKADLMGDDKWQEYLSHCDRFYWAFPPEFDHRLVNSEAFLPERCGLIIADAYEGEILRPAKSEPLAAASRKKEMVNLARIALGRMMQVNDPGLEAFPDS